MRGCRPGAREWAPLATTLVLAACLLAAVIPSAALALADSGRLLTYMPTEEVHAVRAASELDGYMSHLDEYDIGQALLQMPKFKPNGKLKLPTYERETLALWVQQAARHNAEHATHVLVTAVFNANITAKGPDLENPLTRARMIAGIESVLALGVPAIHLDVEPYPTDQGFISFLEELHLALARIGFHGPVSLVAPPDTGRWSPTYLQGIAPLVDQLDPLYYESELSSPAAYETWVRESLAYYSANLPPAVRIIPVIPSYRSNPWHSAAAENVSSATAAIEAALSEGSRVNGAGIWWWYGFYYNENHRFDGSADRAAWQSATVNLPFSP